MYAKHRQVPACACQQAWRQEQKIQAVLTFEFFFPLRLSDKINSNLWCLLGFVA
jgi:hypothetical protein